MRARRRSRESALAEPDHPVWDRGPRVVDERLAAGRSHQDGEADAAITDNVADAEADYEGIGLAAGAGAAVVFPFLLPAVSYAGMAAGGAGLGAWFGHLAHGTSRREAKDIGAMLAPGKAALIVVGIDKDAEQIERALTRAEQHVLKRDVGDWDDAEQEALAAMARAEAAPVG